MILIEVKQVSWGVVLSCWASTQIQAHLGAESVHRYLMRTTWPLLSAWPQVELLLTFEEYCNEEEVFEDQGEHGKAFGDIFDLVGVSCCCSKQVTALLVGDRTCVGH
jgi:hypothetical protein